MNDIHLRTNNHRNGRNMDDSAELPSVQTSSQQRLNAAVQDNTSLQQILETVSTPAGNLLELISRSLGKAEAEIEFIEEIRIKESNHGGS